MKMDMDQFAEVSTAIGNPHRARIVGYLACGPMCGCDLLKYFDFTQPTLSNHMKVLRHANVVIAEQCGKWTHFRLNHELLAAWRACADCLFGGDIDGECHQTRKECEAAFPECSVVVQN